MQRGNLSLIRKSIITVCIFMEHKKKSILIFFDKVLVSGYPKCLYVSESLECDLSSEKICDVSPVHGGARQAFKKGTGKCPARKSDRVFSIRKYRSNDVIFVFMTFSAR